MTILSSFAAFLLPMLLGILIVHMAWEERNGLAIFFKICIGAGLGLGLNSLVYFLCLLAGLKHQVLFFLQISLLVVLIIFTILREIKDGHWRGFRWKSVKMSVSQWFLASIFFMLLVVAALIFINLSTARPQGARDAWSIWNRAARFIYRDPENWSATLAPELFWVTHPDYPLLIPLNVAWGWETLDTETNRIPMMQSALFVFGAIGLMVASVSLARTLGQAFLAGIVLISSPILLGIGYAQISDIPLSFFILAACVSLHLYFKYKEPSLLIMSGFSTGLAAWTKNEGMLFVLAGLSAVMLFGGRKNRLFPLTPYLAGLAFPALVVLYFKLGLAPANDIFSSAGDSTFEKIADLTRYFLIVRYFFESLSAFPGLPLNIFVQLGIYAAIVKFIPLPWSPPGNRLIAGVLILQLLGYCGIYLLTPHDLEWHLYFSFGRLIFHIYPAALFLYFCLINDPENVFKQSPS